MTADRVELLTPRERECLRLVDQHLSSKQIARELGMSKNSVDTYCDRARRKLGVDDRYAAAKLLAARERDPAVLIASGHDAIRTDSPEFSWPDEDASGEAAYGRTAELREQGGDRQGDSSSSGDRRIRAALARAQQLGGNDTDFLMGAAGTTARRSGRNRDASGDGSPFSIGHTQTERLQAARDGAAGNPLPHLGSPRREFQAWDRGRVGRNDLGPLARLGAIVGVAILTALAFGAVLAGLHALQDLARALVRT
ncbi:helix-turn-helix transcriptional regulator [Phenylobacterium sp.]|uniref:helix-turn-helix domain-containing protein n=1 Tax=Phenylobacterium sp. TaxID=1871053 RepID=UPI002732FC6E|nr:helix-turn-helix transcriptional regulator [Phenylobacterium sp.]MDP3661169.1 helix-turn-helix transcriptional regulator [Phenylobacterium sp.]